RLFLLHPPPPSPTSTLSLHDALPIYLEVLEYPWIAFGLLRRREALHAGRERRVEPLDDAGLKVHHFGIEALQAEMRHPFRIEGRSEEHTSELQSRFDLVCRLLLEKKK